MNGDNQKPAGFPPPSSMPNNSGAPAPAEKPKAPPPPPPEISIRTMKSDLESLKQTGGISPAPKTFVPPELEKVMQEEKPKAPPAPTAPPAPVVPLSPRPVPPPAPAAPLPPRAPMAQTVPPSRITPAEFEKPAKEEMAKPEKKSPIIEEEAVKNDLKKLLVWSGAMVIVVGVGLIGYFYLFPRLFPAQTPPPPPVTTPTPTEPTLPAEPETPEVPEPAFREHVSLLSVPTATSSVQLESASLTSLLSALQLEAQKPQPSGSLVEIILSDANGQISSSDTLASWLPDRAESLQNVFEEDFTTALYYDNDGVWPVYIFNLSLDSSPVEAQTATMMLESSGALTNLFVSPPGNPNTAGFRDGQVDGLATRYLTFSQRGAALNLAWSGDRFIISTSYNGLRQALNNLR